MCGGFCSISIGMDEYLTKPLRKPDLLSMIQKIVNSRRMQVYLFFFAQLASMTPTDFETNSGANFVLNQLPAPTRTETHSL